MLDAEQCRVVAAMVNDCEIICNACAVRDMGKGWQHGEKNHPITEYEVSEDFPDGLWCDDCGGVIHEPFTCECEKPKASSSHYDKEHCGYCGGLMSEAQMAEIIAEEDHEV